ncbi:MAG: SpoIIE family protein phosphatase [Kiritimatiellae bacterium]|nr:SpoIIE family protein phosphatase [Kiritimatiellia bacterium]
MTSRWKTFAWAAALFYVILVLFSWSALTHRAMLQTESMLDYALLDLDATLNGSIDTMLMHAADSITEQLGRPQELSPERIALIARQRDLDEVNVVARDGTFLASTDPRLVGLTMADRPKSREFLVLTNGVRHALSHHFRPGAHNPDVRRKYVGVAFPGGDGLVQVGVDETRVTGMFPSIMGFIFDGWLLGETGFFLCSDLSDGHLISNPARHRDEAKFLAETGYDPDAPDVREDGKTTFRQRLFGDLCDCRAVVFCGHRVIAALPPAEYYSTRTFYVALIAVVLGLVTLAFVLLVRRIDISLCRLSAFYAAEDERRAKEYAIAATIQNSALPGPLAPVGGYSLDAAMHPARDVGGDFYDYFRLDGTHLAFLVADVSGKGVTAALYMMTAKTLIKDTLAALRDPAAALTKVNAELCANNPANMFLTAWVGVLDTETGEIAYANAGHNPPVHLAPKLNFLPAKSGPVLAFMDGVRYKPFTLRLEPGNALFLYTDGVTEALDASGALFGEERLLAALAAASGAEPRSLCTVVRAAVAAFAEGTPQADDITVLAIRRNGPARATRSFPPTQDGIAQASAFLDETLETFRSNDQTIKRPNDQTASALHVILDEIVSNIVKHSGASGFDVGVELTHDPAGVKLAFTDDGAPYDPLAHADPDTTLPASERPIGGLGILMVKKMSDSVSYERTRDRNVFTAFKRTPPG